MPKRLVILLASLVLALAAAPAFAQHRGPDRDYRRGPEHRSPPPRYIGPWRDRNIHRFGAHDFDIWRRGHWFHGTWGGRIGWWWIVGGVYYYYPAPVYPYPSPYVPPVVTAPSPTMWYYCSNPPGYYPYVQSCTVPWQAVPPQ